MTIKDVGARLVISGGPEYVTEMDAASASTAKLTAQLQAAAVAATELEASMARTAAGADVAAVSTGTAAAATAKGTSAAEAAAVASGGVILSSNAEAGARTAAADATAKATAVTVVDNQARQDAILAVGSAAAAVEGHSAAVARNTKTLAQNNVVKKVAFFGTGALAVAAYESIKSYSKFNQLVTQSAVDAGMAQKNVASAQKQLLADVRATGISANDTANSLYRVQSSLSGTAQGGFANVMKTTQDALKLDVLFNVPAGAQTEQTARIMGAMMNAQMPGAKTPDQIMALMNSAVGRGDIRGGDMIGMMGQLLATGKFTGAKAPDIVAWADVLTKLGMQGSRAGTLINHSLQQLTTGSSEQAQKALVSIGIQPGQMSKIITTQGLPTAIQTLVGAIETGGAAAGKDFPSTVVGGKRYAAGQASASAQQDAWLLGDPKTMADWRAGTASPQELHTIEAGFLSKMFGAAKSAAPVLALAADPAYLAKLATDIQNHATPAELQKSYDIALHTAARQQAIAKGGVQSMAVQAGQFMTGGATEGMREFGKVAGYLGQHAGLLQGLMISMTGLVAAAVGVVAVDKIGKIATGIRGIGKAAENLVFKLTNGAFGTEARAATATADEQFQAAVTQFVEAVTKMSAAAVEENAAGIKQDAAGVKMGAAGVEENAAGIKMNAAGAEENLAGGKMAIAGAGLATGALALVSGLGFIVASISIVKSLAEILQGKTADQHILPWNPITRIATDVQSWLPSFGPKYGPDGYAEGTPKSKYNADGTLKSSKPLGIWPTATGTPTPQTSTTLPDGFTPPAGFTGWEGQVNGRLQSGTGTAPNPHVHVYVDGKEIFNAVVNQSKKQAARN